MKSTIRIAVKTLNKIENSIRADQGATYRRFLGEIIAKMQDAYNPNNEGHRSHMGASLIGQECARAIWYNFRWCTKSNFEGRMVRLFNRGHLEEARFIAMLLSIGCKIWHQDENGNQFRISDACGHFGGSGDGVAMGIPDLDANTPCLLEFKTHSEKSFKELEAKGVREAKWEHFVQMNVYMYKMGLAVALYMAVNKNTDALHAELITLNKEVAEQYIDRANKIVWLQQPPKKLSETSAFFKCRYCSHRDVCHLKKAPDLNCRTCEYCQPTEQGGWFCNLHNANCSKELQLTGCHNYMRKKDL